MRKSTLLLICFISFADPPLVLRVDDRQRMARERREEREKQLGIHPQPSSPPSGTLSLSCYLSPQD